MPRNDHEVPNWLRKEDIIEASTLVVMDFRSEDIDSVKEFCENHDYIDFEELDYNNMRWETDLATAEEISLSDHIGFIDYDTQRFDEFELDSLLSGILEPSNYYLVYASGMTWDGSDGYKTFDKYQTADMFRREYEVAIYPEECAADGKVLLCKEFSHDAPTGSSTVIIGLTEDEYDKIENEWEPKQVREFAKKHMDPLVDKALARKMNLADMPIFKNSAEAEPEQKKGEQSL